jgi:hypothetical protein
MSEKLLREFIAKSLNEAPKPPTKKPIKPVKVISFGTKDELEAFKAALKADRLKNGWQSKYPAMRELRFPRGTLDVLYVGPKGWGQVNVSREGKNVRNRLKTLMKNVAASNIKIDEDQMLKWLARLFSWGNKLPMDKVKYIRFRATNSGVMLQDSSDENMNPALGNTYVGDGTSPRDIEEEFGEGVTPQLIGKWLADHGAKKIPPRRKSKNMSPWGGSYYD